MRTWVFATALMLIASPGASAASLMLSPVTENSDSTYSVSVGAAGLDEAAGFDIVLSWPAYGLECVSAVTGQDDLQGFVVIHQKTDNASGRLEAVMLRLQSGANVSRVDSLLKVTFSARSPGTFEIVAHGWQSGPGPVLIDSANNPIPVTGDLVSLRAGPPSAPALSLRQNWPNPFNPGTTIGFEISRSSPVYLRIYDTAGRLVRTLINGERYGPGSWEKDWDGTDREGEQVRSGVYFCVIDAAGGTESRKMVVLR